MTASMPTNGCATPSRFKTSTHRRRGSSVTHTSTDSPVHYDREQRLAQATGLPISVGRIAAVYITRHLDKLRHATRCRSFRRSTSEGRA
jgi:hypothetical protein